MKTLYWIGCLFFIFVASIIGCFLVPFISWCFDSEFYIFLFVFGVLLLIILLPLSRKFKVFSMITFPIVATMVISSGITFCRFGDSIISFDKYILDYNDLYTNYGIKIADGRYGMNDGWMIAYDEYTNKVLINYVANEEIVGERDVWNRDSDGKRKQNELGQYLYTVCDKYNVTTNIYIYDIDGNYLTHLEDNFAYTQCSNSDGDYEYEFYNVRTKKYGQWLSDKIKDEVIAKLKYEEYDVIR